ncbi:MAG: RNA polymerase sigma factor [Bacteroidetes bacterium]|nr:RNA polymerase sigma factor [Bacteroidota bacterium]MBU1486010.1 RNA polymerase sigma factor [Bacteroidota bacterium]MBU2045215.1 RNA polymerase sigma factor [Bacteroidota bacterium]MBU2267611.1 RNA polymerase sigma factor [Bacteroidota bacterium]MBU2376505.1 RNA polymerase sigma factor [Bacteroidota bacterium]
MSNSFSFEEIYQLYSKQVFNLCLNYVYNTEDAQDITQETFIAIFQKLNQFQETSSLKTWIYRVTINKCLDFQKSKKTQKRFGIFISLFHSETKEPISELADFNHPGVRMEDKEGMALLFQAIAELSNQQKTAIILTKIEGHPQKEVAEMMNISVKAVESLIQRAKHNISKKIK